MADDSPFPPSKRGTNPRSLGNLRPGVKGQATLNPEGHNGRTRGERVAKILEGPAVTDLELTMVRKLGLPDDTPLIVALVHREVMAGFGKSDLARKGLREQYAGRPRQQMDLTSSDRSMSLNRQPTTAESRQDLAAVAAALELAAKSSGATDEEPTGSKEGEPEPTAEPKAEP